MKKRTKIIVCILIIVIAFVVFLDKVVVPGIVRRTVEKLHESFHD